MKYQIQFAQKAIILKKEKDQTRILLLKYKNTSRNSQKIRNKYGFPGGRPKFGENVDDGLVREIKEETGILIRPEDPIHIESWSVEKEQVINQIIAVFRICKYLEGTLSGYVSDEAKIEKGEWVEIYSFDFKSNLIEDEIEVFNKILKLLEL